MTGKLTQLTNKITGFVKSRIGLSMVLALQIFVMKATRTKTLVITGTVLIVAGHIVGMHTGICPVKEIKPCQLFTGK